MISIALVDDSLDLLADGDPDTADVNAVNIVIFTKKRDELPQLVCAGDVIRMHRVKVQEWKGDIQLMGMRSSSYAVFHDRKITPSAKHEFELTPHDEERFEELHAWAQNRFLAYPTMKIAHGFKLRDMRRQDDQTLEAMGDATRGARGDLTAMVTAILPVPPEQRSGITPRGFLRIWDGTGPPQSDPWPQSVVALADMARNGDPPEQALEKIASVINKLHTRSPDTLSTLQPPKALTGRVVNVAVWENGIWDFVTQSTAVGSFVRLRNVDDNIMNQVSGFGIRCLMLGSKGYLTPIPDLTYEVVLLLKDHNVRLTRGDPINRHSGVLPLDADQTLAEFPGAEAQENQGVAHNDAAAQSQYPNQSAGAPSPGTGRVEGTCNHLHELLTSAPSSTFSGGVRVLDTIPSLSTLSSGGVNQILVSSESGGYSYRFGVLIADESRQVQLSCVVSEVGCAAIVGMSSDAAAQNSSGALFNLSRVADDESRVWEARIRSVEYQGNKYFLVDEIKEAR